MTKPITRAFAEDISAACWSYSRRADGGARRRSVSDIRQRPRLIEMTGVLSRQLYHGVQIMNGDAVMVYRHQPFFPQLAEHPVSMNGREADRIGQ